MSQMSQRRYRFVQLDVFTDHIFGGNQLAVFPQADGLADAEMQAIAREMNYSETTFVLPAADPSALCRVRIFTPAAELPIAGHPVVGTAIALAHEGRIVPGADARARVSFQLGVGTLPVDVTFAEGRPRFAWMSQPVPSFEPWRGDSDALAAALGLARNDLDEQKFPLERGSVGVPFAYRPLARKPLPSGMGMKRPCATVTTALQYSQHWLHASAGSARF